MKSTLITAVLLATVATACTTTSDVKTMHATLQPGYVPLEEERWAIRQAGIYYREFNEQGLLYREDWAADRLEYIKGRLLSGQEALQDEIALHFFKSPLPNAFAWPDGNIYLHAGLLTTIENEAQLAAIAAHEIAHVTQRHSIKAVIANKNKLIGSHIADFATGGMGLIYFGTFASIMQYSREQETEADEVGLAMLTAAGYPQAAMLNAFESMQRYPEIKHQKQSIYSSHPSFDSRVQNLRMQVTATAENGQQPPSVTEEFQAFKARMMEDSLKILLRNRDFNVAQVIVDEAESYFGNAAKISFYRGEIYHGFYRYPEIAAGEFHFIETGEEKPDEATLYRFQRERSNHLLLAERAYRQAVGAEPAYTKAYRRLGEIAEERGQVDLARSHYQRYLELQPDAVDRNFVEHALDRLNR